MNQLRGGGFDDGGAGAGNKMEGERGKNKKKKGEDEWRRKWNWEQRLGEETQSKFSCSSVLHGFR